MEEFHSL